MASLNAEKTNTEQLNQRSNQINLQSLETTQTQANVTLAHGNEQKNRKRIWKRFIIGIFVVAGICIGGLTRINRFKRKSQTVEYPKIKFKPNITFTFENYFPEFQIPGFPKMNYSCTTGACQHSDYGVVSSLSKTIDPCENFYEYACQVWHAKNPRPSYYPELTVFSKLQKNVNARVSEILSKPTLPLTSSRNSSTGLEALKIAKDFYQDCMEQGYSRATSLKPTTHSNKILQQISNQVDRSNDKRFEISDVPLDKNTSIYNVILNILDEYGGLPMLKDAGSWNRSEFNLVKTMVGMKQKFASAIFLDITSVQDPIGRLEQNSIYISRPTGTGSLIKEIVSQTYKYEHKVLEAWKCFYINVSKELLIFQGKTNFSEYNLEEKAMEIIEVEVELQKATVKKADLVFKIIHGISQPIVISNISSLQIWLDRYTRHSKNLIQIRELIFQLYSPIFVVNRTVKVENIDYLLSVTQLLSELNQEKLANYVMFQMVTNMVPFSTQKMQDYLNNFKNVIWGTTGEKPRKEVCTDLTQQKFPLVVGHAYVQQTVGSQSIYRFNIVKTMFKGIKQVFMDLVTRSTLLYLNKTLLLAKLEFTELCLDYPSHILDKKYIEREYYDLSLPQSTFLEKVMAVNSWLTNKQLNSINIQTNLTDRCKWPFYAGTVGAFHQLPDFLVYFPLAILQPPFYNVDLPKAFNYGSLGSIIGHEIMHGLVRLEYSQFKNGTLTPVSKCLVNQYEGFRIPELQEENIRENGLLSLTENIPDNVGALGALLAYQNERQVNKQEARKLGKFTDEQLFFIGFAQNWCQVSTLESLRLNTKIGVHATGMFRVLGTLQNSKEFAEAWKCRVGSKMNLASYNHEKCTFF